MAAAQESTTARIADGSRVPLVFGADYVLGVSTSTGHTDAVSGRLESRAANGDLVVLVDSSGTTRRVRPSKVLSVYGAGIDRTGEDVPAQRNDETSTEYLGRVEYELGPRYPEWIGTEAGQAVLAAVDLEDKAARKASATKAARQLTDAERRAIRSTLEATRSIRDTTIKPRTLVEEYIANIVGFENLPDWKREQAETYAYAVIAAFRLNPTPDPRPDVVPILPASGAEATADVVDASAKRRRAKAPKATRLDGEPLVEYPGDTPGTNAAIRAIKGPRPYAERNQVWRCGTCKRRTRQPFCENGHERVEAPAGKRRDAR